MLSTIAGTEGQGNALAIGRRSPPDAEGGGAGVKDLSPPSDKLRLERDSVLPQQEPFRFEQEALRRK